MNNKQVYSLNYNYDYTCPVCRQGRISALSLMEAFACNFCQHIFSADLDKQLLTLTDSQLPITWQWHEGGKWTRINPDGINIGWTYGVFGVLFVGLPTTIVGLSSYLFPPLPGSGWVFFPIVWTSLTFLSHLTCLLWLLLEYYQFPVRLYLRAIIQR